MDEELENPQGAEEIGNAEEKKDKNSSSLLQKIPKNVLRISIISVSILVVLIISWITFKHFSADNSEKSKDPAIEAALNNKEEEPLNNFFLPIPEMIVNLKTLKAKGTILRTTFSMQLKTREDETKIKEFLPIVIDQILSYLRDQTIADFEGHGLERMRQALLTRINNIIHPLKIHRVVIKDFIIQ